MYARLVSGVLDIPRKLKRFLRRDAPQDVSPENPGETEGSQSKEAYCDSCGRLVTFEGEESAIVTLSTSGAVTTRCRECYRDAEKERTWRETGIWVGDDLPPSLRSMRPATEEELRQILGASSSKDDVPEKRDSP